MLNALAGRAPYARIHGSVLLGSSPLSKNHLDFVPQFDALNPAHTVYHTLCIMANLKNLDAAECQTRVGELLDMLGLVPLAHKFVGELSSGDRKRVSIGLALIANPSVSEQRKQQHSGTRTKQTSYLRNPSALIPIASALDPLA